jgi:hypothetical protein
MMDAYVTVNRANNFLNPAWCSSHVGPLYVRGSLQGREAIAFSIATTLDEQARLDEERAARVNLAAQQAADAEVSRKKKAAAQAKLDFRRDLRSQVQDRQQRARAEHEELRQYLAVQQAAAAQSAAESAAQQAERKKNAVALGIARRHEIAEVAARVVPKDHMSPLDVALNKSRVHDLTRTLQVCSVSATDMHAVHTTCN